MYINKEQLSHLLRPDHYRSEEFFEIEKREVFEKSWIMIGVKEEIPNPGDFFTTEVLGIPLLVRNCDGEIVTFLNVCGHRHCRITDQKSGNSPTIKCQYHGWEYKADGHTGKIPDANCFKPFDRENTRLKIYRTTLCGSLIFIAISEAAPTFDEFSGKFREIFEQWFGGDTYHFSRHLSWDLKANWKVPSENSLESYHIPAVHQKTIGDHPKEEDQEHEFGTHYSTVITSEPRTFFRDMQDILMYSLGVKPSHNYVHHLVYPNLSILALDPMSMIQTFIPVSPGTHQWHGYVFPRSAKKPFLKAFELLVNPIVNLGARRVVTEDVHVFEESQVGLNSSEYPGVLGTIEERIFAFHEYLLERCESRPVEVSSGWFAETDSPATVE